MKQQTQTPEELLSPPQEIAQHFTPDSVASARGFVIERLTAVTALLEDALILEADAQTEQGERPVYLNLSTRTYIGMASVLRGLTDQLNHLERATINHHSQEPSQ
ncbi:hypothetical protein QWI17_15245 [Gilvimarinus sp. SDUM040013]|uniref:DUF3077 domain-containing protein n=1 Tax=Gilvimarinus gilvus TaxID=3058038 RepID=A0ABU4S163_9GAMM|nr:hypothetical protein [Gilvimarinus sp. SDUM040013]MDO3387197.1 hypothetical protein [Gilvimarinus sp. SDUM040013]MDX6850760.1 hypothetical protein [Gilvimarinus sp. SDUM040013]